MRKPISTVTCSDIHLGVQDPIEQMKDLEDHFFSYIDKVKPDIIAIPGDIMDERVSVNSSTAAIFHMFIDRLVDTGAIIIIVEGTKSHDDNQINVFSHRINDKFRIYSKVTKDNILGYDMLFIPEEYMHDPKEYYKDFINSDVVYDAVFGHGMFTHTAYHGKRNPSFRKLTAPIWDYERDFKDIVKGFINFGHIHTPSSLGKLDYNGSYGRNNHGEEENKGFWHYIYDGKTTKKKFIVNKSAKIFKTVLESDLPIGRDEMISALNSYANESYKLRIRLDRDVDPQRKSDIIGFVNSRLNTSLDKHFERKQQKRESQENGETIHAIVENKYDGMDMVDATVDWVFEKHGLKITRTQVLKILNSDDKYDKS